MSGAPEAQDQISMSASNTTPSVQESVSGDIGLQDAAQSASPAPVPPSDQPRRRRWWFWLLWVVLALLLAVAALLFYVAGTDEGSRRLLAWIGGQQTLIQYRYAGGNIRQGLILDQIQINLKTQRIEVDQAHVQIGWRAVVQRELHFRRASLHGLRLIRTVPSTDEPFAFKPIVLPVTLRFDQAYVHGFKIQNAPNKSTTLDTIILKDALWQGDRLEIHDSSLHMKGLLDLKNVDAQMQFNGLYPIQANGELRVPALTKLGFEPVQINADGSLDTLRAQVALPWQVTQPPAATQPVNPRDRVEVSTLPAQPLTAQGQLTGTVVAHPVRKGVPFEGDLAWQDVVWPLALGQQVRSAQGQVKLNGTVSGIDLQLSTDLQSKDLPKGDYQASLSTDFKKMQIQQLTADLLQGQLKARGQVDWVDGVDWQIFARSQGLQLQTILPAAAQAYVPKQLNADLKTVGVLQPNLTQIGVNLRQDNLSNPKNQEYLQVGVGKLGGLADDSLPLAVSGRWQNLKREVSALGIVDSPRGRAVLLLNPAQQMQAKLDLQLAATTGRLPAGAYQLQLDRLDQRQIRIPKLTYQGVAGQLSATAQADLGITSAQTRPNTTQKPVQKNTPTRWQAQVQTDGLNPQAILASVPFDQLRGRIKLSGQSTALQQTILVDQVDLQARQAAAAKQAARTIALAGSGQAVLLMHPESAKVSGLRGFATRFNGQLNTAGVPDGQLILKAAGTPRFIKLEQLSHRGVAGQLDASGQLDLSDGVAWQLVANTQNLDTGYFAPEWAGRLSGRVDTAGHWQAKRKDVQIRQLNLQGTLRGQPLQTSGQLDLAFIPNPSKPADFVPQRFVANQLRLAWAGNQLTANGNTERLTVDVNAEKLGLIHPELAGRISGGLNLSGQQRAPDIDVNLRADGIKFGDNRLDQAVITGKIVQLAQQPSQLSVELQGLHAGARQLQSASVKFAGIQTAHLLDLAVKSPFVTASTQLAGGLDANLKWLGQLRNGQIDSRKIKLKQDRPAALIWNTDMRAVQLDPHCWVSNGSRLCVVEPLQASPAKGYAAVRLQNLEIATFRDLMPTGIIWQGKLNGQAIGGWQQGQSPNLDAQIYTDSGVIGLTADDPQDPPLTVAYQRLSLVASTQEDGMRIRFDARTPNSGAGYIDGVIDPNAKTINGALVLDNIQLAVLKPFFPAMRNLSGIASVAGGMSGPLVGPQFYGNFKLRDGRVQLANAPINLTQITLDASIRGTQATLTGGFNSGEGVGRLDGKAIWETVPEINLQLSGDQLAVRQAPMLNARVSPEIAVRILPQSRQVTVDGEIRIPRAVIAPPAASAEVISVSPDVRVVDRRVLAVQVPSTDPAIQAASPWRIDADLAVILGDAVEFRGFGARLPLAGRLALRQRGLGNLTANGEVAVSRQSRVEAFGQSLLLRKGIARFTGSLTNPVLEIEAVRSIQDAVVGVKIGGNPTRPEINIFNDAGLTEQEALNALLTGRVGSNNSSTNTAGFKSEVNNTLAAAGLSFGLGGTRQFTNRIGQTFGLSGLAVDAEGVGNDTQVNVTGYITPDLYLRYGVGVFTPVNKLTLRYQINRRLYVEASSALEKAVDVFYNWRF